jgi:tRNA threonylcarbamoyladenosine biosynthesis protein TsaB
MILALNTATPQFSVALLQAEGSNRAETILSSGTKNFTYFLPGLRSLLSLSGASLYDLKAIVVAIGPGSYTGLRVGLAAAKGMAYGLKIPIIGVSSLEAMASQLPYTPLPICPMIGSRKGEFFSALFAWSDDCHLTRLKEEMALKIENLGMLVPERTLFLGNDFNIQAELIKKRFGHKALLAPPHLWNLKASAVGSLGLQRFHQGNFDNLRDLVPCYLRPPAIRSTPQPP